MTIEDDRETSWGRAGWAQYEDFGVIIKDLGFDFKDWWLRIGIEIQDLGIGVQS